jgi:PleD family two-component response regulator
MVNTNADNNHDNASSRSDFVDVHVKKMVNGIRIFLNPRHGNTTPEEEAAAAIKINSATKKYAEIKIKILEDAPRDANKLKQILRTKQKQYDKAQDSEEIERLITEIDTLKYLLFLVIKASETKKEEGER